MIFTISQVNITVTLSDDSTESFNLEAPNSRSTPFVFGYRRMPLKQAYRDRDIILRRGVEYYQFFSRLSYDWHRMDLRTLLVAKSIELKIPPTFIAVEGYQSFDCRLSNDEVLRNWLNGLAMSGTGIDGQDIEEFEIPPSGEISLEFVGTKPFTNAELLADSIWYQSLAPYAPLGLAIEGQGGSTITVSWDEHKDPSTAGFNVYANGVKNNASLITVAEFEANGFQHQLTGLQGLTEYEVKVTALDADGNESPKSAGVTTTTESPVGPFIWLQDANSRFYVIDYETGAQIGSEQSGLYDGSSRCSAIDPVNHYLYTVGSFEDVRQYDYDPVTGVVTTPHNWEQGSVLNFSISDMKVGPNGFVYVACYSQSGNASGDGSIICLDPADGSFVWAETKWSVTGIAPHPLGVIVKTSFGSNNFTILDYDDGSEVANFNVTSVGGGSLSGIFVRPAVDKDGFIFISKSDDAGSGIYRIDPSDFSTTHYREINSGAGLIQVGSDYLFVSRANGRSQQAGGGQVLSVSDLSPLATGINCEGPEVYDTAFRQIFIGMDATDRYYWADNSDNTLVTCKDKEGNTIFTFNTINACYAIWTPATPAYPWLA